MDKFKSNELLHSVLLKSEEFRTFPNEDCLNIGGIAVKLPFKYREYVNKFNCIGLDFKGDPFTSANLVLSDCYTKLSVLSKSCWTKDGEKAMDIIEEYYDLLYLVFDSMLKDPDVNLKSKPFITDKIKDKDEATALLEYCRQAADKTVEYVKITRAMENFYNPEFKETTVSVKSHRSCAVDTVHHDFDSCLKDLNNNSWTMELNMIKKYLTINPCCYDKNKNLDEKLNHAEEDNLNTNSKLKCLENANTFYNLLLESNEFCFNGELNIGKIRILIEEPQVKITIKDIVKDSKDFNWIKDEMCISIKKVLLRLQYLMVRARLLDAREITDDTIENIISEIITGYKLLYVLFSALLNGEVYEKDEYPFKTELMDTEDKVDEMLDLCCKISNLVISYINTINESATDLPSINNLIHKNLDELAKYLNFDIKEEDECEDEKPKVTVPKKLNWINSFLKVDLPHKELLPSFEFCIFGDNIGKLSVSIPEDIDVEVQRRHKRKPTYSPEEKIPLSMSDVFVSLDNKLEEHEDKFYTMSFDDFKAKTYEIITDHYVKVLKILETLLTDERIRKDEHPFIGNKITCEEEVNEVLKACKSLLENTLNLMTFNKFYINWSVSCASRNSDIVVVFPNTIISYTIEEIILAMNALDRNLKNDIRYIKKHLSYAFEKVSETSIVLDNEISKDINNTNVIDLDEVKETVKQSIEKSYPGFTANIKISKVSVDLDIEIKD